VNELDIDKKDVYKLVSVVCIFWLIANVAFPIAFRICYLSNEGRERRGWRGWSSEYNPDIDTYIGEHKQVVGIYKGYHEATSVGNPEYIILIDNDSYMCWWTKDAFITSLDNCLGKEITLYLELYDDWMDVWVITGFKLN